MLWPIRLRFESRAHRPHGQRLKKETVVHLVDPSYVHIEHSRTLQPSFTISPEEESYTESKLSQDRREMEAGVEGSRNTDRNQEGERMSHSMETATNWVSCIHSPGFKIGEGQSLGCLLTSGPADAEDCQTRTPSCTGTEPTNPAAFTRRRAAQPNRRCQGEHKVANVERGERTDPQAWEVSLPSHLQLGDRPREATRLGCRETSVQEGMQ